MVLHLALVLVDTYRAVVDRDCKHFVLPDLEMDCNMVGPPEGRSGKQEAAAVDIHSLVADLK